MTKTFPFYTLVLACLLTCPAMAVEWTPTLDNTPNLHTTTLTLNIKAKPNAPEKIPVELHNLAESVWAAEVPAGETTLTAKDFKCTKEGRVNDGLVFGYITKITAPDEAAESIEAKWSGDDGVRYPWEVDPAPEGKAADGATIWPGLHRENAGHFSLRYEPNGILTDNVMFDGISRQYHYLSAVEGEFWQFHFVIPDSAGTVRTVSQEKNENEHMSGLSNQVSVQSKSSEYNPKDVQADWTSFRWTRKIRTKDGKVYTKQLRYGTMALGVQVETDSPKLAVGYGPAGKGHGNLFLAMPTAEGLKIVSPGGSLDPSKMSQNWLLMVDSDNVGSIPVMLIFQHKPDALDYQDSGLTITREKGVGTIAVGAPFGAPVLAPEKVRQWSKSAGRIPKAKLLKFRSFLMAYPWGCNETFSVKDNNVHIQDTMTFLSWQDDWNTKCEPASPLPPMVALSVERGYLPKSTVTDITHTGIVTRFGPYWVRKGDKIDYTLPVPRAWDNFSLRTQPPENLAWLDQITRKTLGGVSGSIPMQQLTPRVWTHEMTFDHSAGCWRAVNYMTPEERAYMRDASRLRILGGLLPQNYRLRTDPITGAKYMGVSFVWYGKEGPWGTFDLEPNGMGYNDEPFWLGINLYGIYTQAKYNASWDRIQKNWPVVRSLLSYYEFYNSWLFMDPGAMESGSYYHADMPTAGYAGLVGYYYLAKQLGTPYQRDLGAYLLARSAVPMGCKLGFRSYMENNCIRHCELVDKALPSGFGEEFLASLHRPVAGKNDFAPYDPWWETGCIGPQSGQPEVMDLYMERCYDDFANFERIFLECCPNSEFSKNDDVRIIPHVMARTRMGDDMLKSGAELVQLQNRDQYLPRDVQAFAEILSAQCPLKLLDWTPGYIEDASWDEKAGQANLSVDGGEKGCTLLLTSRAFPVRISLDNQNVGQPVTRGDSSSPKTFEVAIPAGKHVVQLSIPQESLTNEKAVESK